MLLNTGLLFAYAVLAVIFWLIHPSLISQHYVSHTPGFTRFIHRVFTALAGPPIVAILIFYTFFNTSQKPEPAKEVVTLQNTAISPRASEAVAGAASAPDAPLVPSVEAAASSTVDQASSAPTNDLAAPVATPATQPASDPSRE